MTKDFQSLFDNDFSDTSHSPVVLTGDELEQLVSPVSCEEFANSCFSRLSLYVEGQPNQFAHIFSFERLKQALGGGRKIGDKRFNRTPSYGAGEESGSPKPMFVVNVDQVGELLKA